MSLEIELCPVLLHTINKLSVDKQMLVMVKVSFKIWIRVRVKVRVKFSIRIRARVRVSTHVVERLVIICRASTDGLSK
jgi:hypothetical protein